MIRLLVGLLFLQAGVRNDVAELRQYLGTSYRGLIQALDSKNQFVLRNVGGIAPAQAAEMRARMRTPDRLPTGNPIVSAKIDNVGQGLLSFLFDGDFVPEQVNFVFCPAEQERLMTIQVLLDDRTALGSTVDLLQKVYQLPPPLAPKADYKYVLPYPFRTGVLPTIWSLGTVEVLYQPVLGQKLVTGQLWLTDTTVVSQCTALPKLPSS
jgi:hypothetical protein